MLCLCAFVVEFELYSCVVDDKVHGVQAPCVWIDLTGVLQCRLL